jgi:hypothetical protein
MASITTSFGTVTALTPASFTFSYTATEAASLMAELKIAFTPTANRAQFPDTYALYQGLITATQLTATAGSGGTAPPVVTQLSAP